jgi:hypothetical protein
MAGARWLTSSRFAGRPARQARIADRYAVSVGNRARDGRFGAMKPQRLQRYLSRRFAALRA